MPTPGAKVGRSRRPRPTDETRAAVLDAAEECFLRYGIQQTTIDDIVRVAGIPRATLYRHTGGRDDLLIAVATREMDRVFTKLERFIAERNSLSDVIVDGVLQATKLIIDNPVLGTLSASPDVVGSRSVSDHATAGLFERLHRLLTPLLDAAQEAGHIRRGLTTSIAVEHLLRVVQSQITFGLPGKSGEKHRRHYLAQTLLPAFLPDGVNPKTSPPDLPLLRRPRQDENLRHTV